MDQDRHCEAEEIFRECIDPLEQVYGKTHDKVTTTSITTVLLYRYLLHYRFHSALTMGALLKVV